MDSQFWRTDSTYQALNYSRIITVIPVYNGQAFIGQTLASVAQQTMRPDRVIVLDDGSTDATPEIVRDFKELACEYIRNPANLGLVKNYNRALDFAKETDYLQILHADDLIEPDFYRVMAGLLEDCPGRGMAWCLDERIDENNQKLSLSGKADGRVRVFSKDQFLRAKAELGNQAFCATLFKTDRKPAPCLYEPEFLIVNDMVFYADFAVHCHRLVQINLPLGKYRWHGNNTTSAYAPTIQSLVLDEWKAMMRNEGRREQSTSILRKWKLKGLFAVRSGIKAKRFRQNGNPDYAREIVQAVRNITGWPLWVAGQVLVELRDLAIYKIGGRTRHPKNIYG
ncbi:MAG: glycosyltransferase family 2 protein [Verrucomicrobiota bacterium]